MYKALYISPMIPSFNLKETISFFTEILDFSVRMDTSNYAVLSKDHLTVHILNAGKDIGEMEFYLEVDNLDLLWESIKGRIKETKVREPFDREYGMREFHMVIPFTKTLLFVGQVYQ